MGTHSMVLDNNLGQKFHQLPYFMLVNCDGSGMTTNDKEAQLSLYWSHIFDDVIFPKFSDNIKICCNRKIRTEKFNQRKMQT